ncbi:MAG TPA: thioesterase domain-containing protein [Terriglobales bacterium]|nr:thioesterase domain-containing protein [Terriglobales bacterium]
MIPSAFVFLDFLPLTPNGKVNRRALPAPDRSGVDRTVEIVAPRNEVERQLTEIWKEILGIPSLGVQENFFDLGGHSILALRLIARVEKRLNRPIPLAALFARPSIEGLAEYLRKAGYTPKWNWLVPLQSIGSKPPFFLLHGREDLARHIGQDQPIYGVQHHLMDGKRAPSSVAQWAADYIHEIRTVQSAGPYYIGGYSFGGLVAFELACQLREQDQEVALLVLLDPTNPGGGKPRFPSSSTSLKRTITKVNQKVRRYWRSSRAQIEIKHLWTKIQRWLNRAKVRIQILISLAFLAVGRRVPVRMRSHYAREVNLKLARRFVPRVYPGGVCLLRSRNTEIGSFDWSKFVAGRLVVDDLLGEHRDVLHGPRIKIWAERVRVHLQNAQTNAAHRGRHG